MTRRLTVALTITGAMALHGCAPAAPEMNAPADIAAVNALRTGFQTAFNAGDAEGVLKGYSADPISMGNHQPTAVGRDAILAGNKAQFANATFKIDIVADETMTMGTSGFDRGHFKITVTPKAGGPPMTDEGRYVVLVEKGPDGAWKVTRSIENSSLPMPMPPMPPPVKGK